MQFDYQAFAPFLLAAAIGFVALSAADARALYREGAPWSTVLRLPLVVLGTSTLGSVLLAARAFWRQEGDFLLLYADHLGAWLAVLALVATAVGMFLFLPALFLEMRRRSEEPHHVGDYFVAALLVLVVADRWMVSALTWAYPWGGVACVLFAFLVLTLLRIRSHVLFSLSRDEQAHRI